MTSRASTGAAEYAVLSRALDDHKPACTGDPRFILEPHELPKQVVDHLSLTVCRPCPLRAACRAYGESARPSAGVWGGKTYETRGYTRRHPKETP